MTTNKSGKIRIYLYVLLTIAGCVFACSSIIPNDYIKLVVVMGTLCVGLYGIMKGLSSTGTSSEEEVLEKNNKYNNYRILKNKKIMRINKDLADAIMMVSFIVLVLVGTTTFDNEVTKNVTMGSLGVITVAMLVLRVIGSRQKEEEEAF